MLCLMCVHTCAYILYICIVIDWLTALTTITSNEEKNMTAR